MIEPKAGDWVWLHNPLDTDNHTLVQVIRHTPPTFVTVAYRLEDGSTSKSDLDLIESDKLATDSEVLAAKLKGEI